MIQTQGGFKELFLFLFIALGLTLGGCETLQAVKKVPQPQTFLQTVALAQSQLKNARDTMNAALQFNGEDCQKAPDTKLCKAAVAVDEKTREWRDQLDLIPHAYNLVQGDLSKCVISFKGVSFPCQDRKDQALAALLEINQAMATAGVKQ